MSEPKTISQLLSEAIQDRWPRVTFDPKSDTIDLWRYKGQQEGGVEPYWIPWARCDSSAKLLGWIIHLCEKNWITNKHIAELIELCHARGIEKEPHP